MIRAAAGIAAVLSLYSGVAWATQPWEFEPLVWAKYTEPTARYPHGVLGDDIEYGALVLQYAPDYARYTIRLPQDLVFEDIAPRLVDIDGDGKREAMVVESHRDKGARLAFYNGGGLIVATPYIGTRNRWLAPIGLADLDGDGHVEVAYIDRPHLAKTLRIWRFEDGGLTEVASAPGYSNHKIGWDFIAGGLRECGDGPEMILATGNWRQVVSVRWDGQQISLEELGRYRDPQGLNAELACP